MRDFFRDTKIFNTEESTPIISINTITKEEKYYASIHAAGNKLSIYDSSISYQINRKDNIYEFFKDKIIKKRSKKRGLKASDGNTYIFRKATKEEIEKYGK